MFKFQAMCRHGQGRPCKRQPAFRTLFSARPLNTHKAHQAMNEYVWAAVCSLQVHEEQLGGCGRALEALGSLSPARDTRSISENVVYSAHRSIRYGTFCERLRPHLTEPACRVFHARKTRMLPMRRRSLHGAPGLGGASVLALMPWEWTPHRSCLSNRNGRFAASCRQF